MNSKEITYQPTQEDNNRKAEEMMTEEEIKISEERERESLFQKLESINKIRIFEADAMAEDMTRLSKDNEDVLFEMVLKSPDLVTDFLFKKLDGKTISTLLENMSIKIKELSQQAHNYEEKYYKNHNPIDFTSCNVAMQDLDSSLQLSQNIDNIEDPSERISLLNQITGSIKIANMAKLQLERELKFIERIAKDIESKRPYYHISSFESDTLNNNNDYTIYPGIANAWDEGVYVSERPLLYYLGGEEIKKEMKSCVIFAFPVDEDFIFNQGSATDEKADLINANTNKRCVRFKNILKSQLKKDDLIRMGAVGAEKIDPNIPIYLITSLEISMDSNYQEERKRIFS